MEFLPITKGVTGRSKSWYFRPFHRSTPPNFMPTWPFRHYILLKRLNAYRFSHLYFSYQNALSKDTKSKAKHCRIKTFLLKVESNLAECWKPVHKLLQDSFGIKCGLFSAKELHWPTLSMTISYFLNRCLKRRLEIVLWNYIRLIKDLWRYHLVERTQGALFGWILIILKCSNQDFSNEGSIRST